MRQTKTSTDTDTLFRKMCFGKTAYKSKLEAVAVAVKYINLGVYRRAYRCPFCHKYHLTHKRKSSHHNHEIERRDQRVWE